jgi:hypothetical protein
MSNDPQSAFAAWEAGDLTDLAALRVIWSDLREVEDQIALLNEQRDAIREQISQIIAKTGTMVVAGFGKAMLTAPTRVVSYDSKQLGLLWQDLSHTHPDIARRIQSTQKISERSGGLRIEKEK